MRLKQDLKYCCAVFEENESDCVTLQPQKDGTFKWHLCCTTIDYCPWCRKELLCEPEEE
jgi:hypothetical protein